MSNSNDFFNELKKIIDLPDRVVSLNLYLRIDEAPKVFIETIAEKPTAENQTITSRYEIVAIDAD